MEIGTLMATLGMDDGPFAAGLAKAADKLRGFAKDGGKIAAAAGLGIATVIGGSIVANLNLQEGRNKLAAELGLTEADSARIGKVAGALFADNYGESMGDVNDAIAAVVSSIGGMREASDADINAAAKNALNLAKVFDVDVSRAAQLAGQMVKTGLADTADEAFDLLIQGAQNVPTALQGDLMDAVDEYGKHFEALGFSGKEAFQLLVNGAKDGMYGIDKTGDAIAEFTKRGLDMSAATSEAYKAIGLDAHTMTNEILAGGDKAETAFQKVVSGLLAIEDPAARQTQALALFGTPLEDLGTKDIPAFLTSLQNVSGVMDDAGGASQRMDKQLSKGAVASLGRLKRQAQAAFLTLGDWAIPKVDALTAALADNFGPALEDVKAFLEDVIDVIKDVIDWMEEHETTARWIAGVILTVLAPAIMWWGTQMTISAAKSVAAWILSGGAAVTGAARTVASATIAGLAMIGMGAQALAGAARMAAAWLIAMGPIGLVIAAVAGVVFLVVKYWDEIKAATAAAWDWVWGKIKAVAGFIVKLFLNFTVPGLIIKHWGSIKTATGKVWDWIKDKITGFVRFFRQIPGKITSATSGMWDGLKRSAAEAFNKVAGLWNSTVGRLSFRVPGWVPGMGGKGWDVPDIPTIRLAKGGIIPATPGGVFANIAEAGHAEAVLPLDGPNAPKWIKDGPAVDDGMREIALTAADRRLMSDFIAAVEHLANRPAQLVLSGRQAGVIVQEGQNAIGRHQ